MAVMEDLAKALGQTHKNHDFSEIFIH